MDTSKGDILGKYIDKSKYGKQDLYFKYLYFKTISQNLKNVGKIYILK